MSETGEFSAHWVLHAEGARIGIATCLTCGAAVLLDDLKATTKHLAWHLAAERAEVKA